LKGGSLAEVGDDLLVNLLMTIFWAGLETHEGRHNATGIVFLGTSRVDFVVPEGVESGTTPLYQWKVLRFDSPRPFAVGELVKLAVAGVGRRIFTAVNVGLDGNLSITGLVREGFNVDPDPFVKIIASTPGCLSIYSGGDLLFTYERGGIIAGGEDVIFSPGLVRRAFEAMARGGGLGDDVVPDYLRAVRSLVREMAAHDRGGILIVSVDDYPEIAKATTYRMAVDSSLACLLNLP